MGEVAITVRLRGATASILQELLDRGYYTTKAEVIRAGIHHLAGDFGLLKTTARYREGLESEIARKKIEHEEIEHALENLEK